MANFGNRFKSQTSKIHKNPRLCSQPVSVSAPLCNINPLRLNAFCQRLLLLLLFLRKHTRTLRVLEQVDLNA